MSAVVQGYVSAISDAFRRAPTKQAAHDASRPILLDMAADDQVLPLIVAQHVSQVANLNTRNYPSLGMSIASNAHFVLVANAFFAHPYGLTDVTVNSVHHHGEMLLTTVSAFGPGYWHWLFSAPELVAPEKNEFSIKLLECSTHEKGNLAFVDAHVPHAVMYPESLTLTYALWSSRRATSWRDYAKRTALIKANADRLGGIAQALGLSKALDIKLTSYLDFFPTSDGFCGMPERKQFERGPNEDYLQSLFSLIQATDCAHVIPIIRQTALTGRVDNPAQVSRLVSALERGDDIAPKFSDGLHLNVPHMNFSADAILKAVG